jgi:hypothetical protein
VSGSSSDNDGTTDADGVTTGPRQAAAGVKRGAPSNMRAAGSPDRRKLAAVPEAARLLNACLGHHIRDRVTGRFYPPDFHEMLNGLASADQDHLVRWQLRRCAGGRPAWRQSACGPC